MIKRTPKCPIHLDGRPILVSKGPHKYQSDRFKPEYVCANTSLIRQMSEDDVKWFRNHSKIKGKRYFIYQSSGGITRYELNTIRNLLDERERELLVARREFETYKDLEEKVWQLYVSIESILDKARAERSWDMDRTTRVLGTDKRNSIYDLTPISLNLVSIGAKRSQLPPKDLTIEHVFPRTKSATEIVTKCALNKIQNIQSFIIHLIPLCSVNLVLESENNKLGQLVRGNWKAYSTPAALYEACGIELIRYKEGISIPWPWVGVAETYHIDLYNDVQFPEFKTVDLLT